ncbi:MAG: HEAT repeat domain-containing protein [Alphaproteobacteria bacterium]|nr:HEAT repeat domain-containing protein [Alphaproteobacteria bacterium]
MSGRKRPRLFSFGRETELANLDSWVEDADQRALLVSVVDAFIEVTRTRKLAPENLAPVLAAAVHPSENVRAIGITRLAVLTHYFPEALAAFGNLVHHSDPGVRLYACASLANAPEEALPDLLRDFLADPSWEVRKSAAQVCATTKAAEILTLVDQRLQRERDARVRVVLELAARFQRDQRP